MSGKIAFGGIRKVIAGRMQQSLQSTAQLTYHTRADVTAIGAQLPDWKAAGKAFGLQDCLILCLVRALAAHPLLNGTADGDGYELSEVVDLSIALASPAGLVTPVLRDLAGEGLDRIAVRRRELVQQAQAGKLAVSQMKGGTFTLSNLGLTAVDHFTPILNAPQIGILGVGRIGQDLVLDDQGKLALRHMLPLSLTADHRVVDGEPAGRFLTCLVDDLARTDWLAA